jgi:hypothetical protein
LAYLQAAHGPGNQGRLRQGIASFFLADDRFTVAVRILTNPLNQLGDVVQRPGSLMPEILTGGAIELLTQFPQIGQIDLKNLGGREAVLTQEKGEKDRAAKRKKLCGLSAITFYTARA